MSTGRQVPLARPDIGPRERELVNEVLENGPLALGPRAVEFEQRLAERAGRAYGVSCSSGTAGLHMAVRALGIADGDEVITTPFSFVASANCLLYERARPVFVDIEEDALGLDPNRVEAASGPRTVGILPVHVFGRPCRIDESPASPTAPVGNSSRMPVKRSARASADDHWAPSAPRPCSPSTRTSRSRPVRAAWS